MVNFRFVIITILIAFLSISSFAENNEKSILLNSTSLGNWKKANKIKKSGKITLKVWDSYIEYANRIPNNTIRNIMLKYANKLDIEYDEIWIYVADEGFSSEEKKKFKNQFDIHKLYWKKDKVQALTLEKYYISDPITNKRVGNHKITQVWDRDSIFKELR